MAVSTFTGIAQDSLSTQVWTLQRCIEHAKQENVGLQRKRVAVQQAQISVADARANRQPTVNFTSSQQYSNKPFQSSTPIVSGDEVISTTNKNSYSGTYAVNATMPLYNGGSTSNNIKLQQLNSQIAELNVNVSELTLEEDITKAYVQILYAQEAVKHDNEQIALSEKQLERAQALFKAGLLNKADVAQLESQTANDRYQLVADDPSTLTERQKDSVVTRLDRVVESGRVSAIDMPCSWYGILRRQYRNRDIRFFVRVPSTSWRMTCSPTGWRVLRDQQVRGVVEE